MGLLENKPLIVYQTDGSSGGGGKNNDNGEYGHALNNMRAAAETVQGLGKSGLDFASLLFTRWGPNIINFVRDDLKESIQKLIDSQNKK